MIKEGAILVFFSPAIISASDGRMDNVEKRVWGKKGVCISVEGVVRIR